MKKLFLVILVASAVSMQAQVMAPFTESFSTNNALPPGWTNTSTSGTGASLWRASDGREPTNMQNDASAVDDHTGDSGYFLWVRAGYLGQAGNSATLEIDYINMDSLASPEVSLATYSFDTSNVQLAPDANKLKIDFFDGTTCHDSILAGMNLIRIKK